MSEVHISILHSYDITPIITCSPEKYAPRGALYFLPDKDSKTFFQYGRDIYKAEKEMNDWIRRYQNALNGLNYWRARALEGQV